ncbi:5'/3'-nucleotidase SurE [Actinocrispum sp. NPDC049592]|uniref:5'/3'-nucleotidase SurE n=1 Tax=Actinocrispum sp. NPDC049592 TaxID=3154835 RepID=UPI0034400281
MTRVLVTNDDGIHSPGLAALARCAVDFGWETLIAAPATEASGASAAVHAAVGGGQVVIRRHRLPGLEDVEAYAVSAQPGLIAMVAGEDGFGTRPDVVLSGVNLGANIGRAVLHSGTVGAAMTAAIHGARAMAVSLDVGLGGGEPLWDSAAAVVSRLLPKLAGLSAGDALNVNVPNVPADRLRPPRIARLATYGQLRSKVTRIGDEAIELATIEVEGELEAGTDAALLADGYVTVTPLRSIHEDHRLMGLDLS